MGVARREDPVYAGFEFELAGAERYPRAGSGILYRRLRVLLPNSLMPLQKRAEHGFEIWS